MQRGTFGVSAKHGSFPSPTPLSAYVYLKTPKETIFYVWRQRSNALANDDIRYRQDILVACIIITIKILTSVWLSNALISALIGQFNVTVRVMPK